MKAGPVVSDNANFIIDAPFEKEVMKDPYTVNFLNLPDTSDGADTLVDCAGGCARSWPESRC